jgi:galactokinase
MNNREHCTTGEYTLRLVKMQQALKHLTKATENEASASKRMLKSVLLHQNKLLESIELHLLPKQ